MENENELNPETTPAESAPAAAPTEPAAASADAAEATAETGTQATQAVQAATETAAPAAAEASSQAAEQSLSFWMQAAEYFQDGDVFMWPLVVVLVLGLAIVLERLVFLVGARVRNRSFWNKVQPKLQQQDFRGAHELTDNSSTAVSRIIAYGLDRLNAGGQRDDVETAMEEGLMEQMPRIEKRTHYLATLANVATLLGLLGTIWGMIGAFDSFLNTVGDAKIAALSSNIAQAMLTTAFGLLIAIPLLLAHAWLQSRTTELIDSLEMAAVKFLNLLKR